jgi:hypothetical protein
VGRSGLRLVQVSDGLIVQDGDELVTPDVVSGNRMLATATPVTA